MEKKHPWAPQFLAVPQNVEQHTGAEATLDINPPCWPRVRKKEKVQKIYTLNQGGTPGKKKTP